MNDYTLSVILGIVEGLTEFLPVSSTAHLRLAQELASKMHWTDINLNDPYWKMYTVVIQLGAILCLPVYFLPRILKLVKTFPKGERGDRTVLTHPLSLVMIAFVVTAGPSFLFAKKIGENLDNFYVIGGALLIGGIVMWIVDAMYGDKLPKTPSAEPEAVDPNKTAHVEEMSLLQAIGIGAAQILSAVFPGTSRSMCTIAAGQIGGMTRSAALEFSFFLSIPTMFVATIFTLLKTLHPKPGTGDPFSPKSMDGHEWAILGIGLIVSFIVALGVVAGFMSWVRRRGFVPFAIYRIVLGIAVLWWVYSSTHAS